jgi:hypothetical protein
MSATAGIGQASLNLTAACREEPKIVQCLAAMILGAAQPLCFQNVDAGNEGDKRAERR